ncbi:uncharacterized protein LOC130809434 [Amaranthus tricolor]|uniref:uncharacterized protein LOC130809434 n=1 Tax=Amaranthus tricolor TaxID=29722 RepID=UPI002589D55A|nr:uncharacterized protein LOC130809434 [Amaranthus tricolor]
MATLQMCKHAQLDQNKHQNVAQNNEKKHHLHFWQKPGNEHKNDHAIKKHQPNVGHHNKQGHEYKNGHATYHDHVSHPRGHKLRQCFGHGSQIASDVEESETIVIERKIEERVVINHVKKSHQHKEGANKHLKRC